MKIHLVTVGRTDKIWLNTGIDDYLTRIRKYISFEIILINNIKNRAKMSEQVIKNLEGEQILKKIAQNDVVILLDEKGKSFTSKEFAVYFQKQINSGAKNIFFITGGAYGFSKAVYDRSNFIVSLSEMTFSHQMVRLIFAEQLYRALSIINNEPYHHGD